MHEPDVGVQRDRERLPGDACIAVRERNRVLFVHAEQELGPRVAEMVDEAVVQAAKARTRSESDVRNLERAQELRDRIAAPGGGRLRVRFVARLVVHARTALRSRGVMCRSSLASTASDCSACTREGQRNKVPGNVKGY